MFNELPLTKDNTALIVDDDPAQRFLLQAVLGHIGIAVKEAENGLDALDIIMREPIDIILMDVNMPIMNGFDACKAIRSLPAGQYIPIVLITGVDDHKSIEMAFAANATDFMVKPVNWPILGHRIQYILKNAMLLRQLHSSEKRLIQTQKIAILATWERDLDATNYYFSSQFGQMLNIPSGHLKASESQFFSCVHQEDKADVIKAIEDSIQQQCAYSIDYRVVLNDLKECFIHEQGELVYSDEGVPLRFIGTIQDITARKKDENKIRQLAYYDTLTGLPNRAKFKLLVEESLQYCKLKFAKAAMIFIDLDNFKRVNDTLGHDAGDSLLQYATQKIKDALIASHFNSRIDSVDVALSRLGGDEFTLFIYGIDEEKLASVAQEIHNQLCTTTQINQQNIRVTASIGIAMYPNDGEDYTSLLKNSDVAMYQSKAMGRNTYQFYCKHHNIHSKDKLQLETELSQAIEKNQLELHYQPQIDISTGKLRGLEALIRWQHPVKGLLYPQDFIFLAEETTLIIPIVEWVIKKACKQFMLWQEAGVAPFIMSFNISGKQFSQTDVSQVIMDNINHFGLEPRYFEIELTENILIELGQSTLNSLIKLRKCGIKVAIDDFGVGYSSLNYLKNFPLDTLKIDKSFVEDICINPKDAIICKTIIQLAKNLNLSIVAEGVESKGQYDLLRQQGCDYVQGYIYSKALPEMALTQKMKMNQSKWKFEMLTDDSLCE